MPSNRQLIEALNRAEKAEAQVAAMRDALQATVDSYSGVWSKHGQEVDSCICEHTSIVASALDSASTASAYERRIREPLEERIAELEQSNDALVDVLMALRELIARAKADGMTLDGLAGFADSIQLLVLTAMAVKKEIRADERRKVLEEAAACALGCKDYSGGYRGDPEKLDIFHHGIDTVAKVLKARRDNPTDTQSRVVLGIGREELAALDAKEKHANN